MSATATGMALGFPGKAGTAPLVVGSLTTLLALVVLASEVRGLVAERHARQPARPTAGNLASTLRANPYLWLLLYGALFALGGAVVALAAFSVCLIRFRGGQGWMPTLVFSALSTLAFFLVVRVALDEPLYHGLLFG
ncbi:tripartite tricarboxylate transporter TctB family protein [Haloechinothrix sp. YIM 98757]|uniref:Tripartite tricarboxylate transporter TctB family protein n=1 Tax=Haloechinothrix aidingensis TaxID=2752311 RepID=A0A838A4C8_9PSEU|nr:tripartite tricarboxylate transporter TctB family protein [Haloechinothrix aidingensis]